VGSVIRRLGRPAATSGARVTSRRERLAALFLTVVVTALGTLSFPTAASAAEVPAEKQAKLCAIEEWKADFKSCVDRLGEVGATRVQCLDPPTPSAPDSGMAGWFASRPESSTKPGASGLYSQYGYAGYSYTTYDLGGCASTLTHPDNKFETTVANGEFMIATSIIGASNAVRERAWDPAQMWGWADPLVQQATRAVYEQVFSVFGTITVAIVGLYLIWRSRQSDMSAAMTTAGWALLVMVGVTAVAAWPTFSAHIADQTLVSALNAVHGAVGPPSDEIPANQCKLPNPAACKDNRLPAVRASDTVTESMLFRNWVRGELGSADSATAQKYGQALYDAKSYSWSEIEDIRRDPALRDPIIQRKNAQWMKVAEQIKAEDPEAYQYLQGINGMDRIGAGFIAMLAAVLFAMFDLTAALLVLLGFLLFRWAVIAAPILGTVGLLRPASAGVRRLANAVVAAMFNIVIFGTGAAIYLFAVDLIMKTATLPGWLQVVLVWLCGVVGWILLRPYRRITQLGGKDSTSAVTSAGSWHRRFFRDVREAAKLSVVEPGGTAEPTFGGARRRALPAGEQRATRPEHRHDDVDIPTNPGPASAPAGQPSGTPSRRIPVPSGAGWSEPSKTDNPANYSIYRPARTPSSTPAAESAGNGRRVRSEAMRDH
jgi:hypothetical protein